MDTPAPDLPPFPPSLAGAGPVLRVDAHRTPSGFILRASRPDRAPVGIMAPRLAEALRILADVARNGGLD